ncbi:MAG TPA: cytochrome c biogenesis protein CcdA [Candidatus Aenigmarchaeota archaeon]|nr:cytochrome c biogenesis protein CcdA [Candidatus Aenigmarchaeota archaeon]
MMTRNYFIICILLALSLFSLVTAALPTNLENLKKAEIDQAQLSLRSISFIIAFIAGILSLFSPCILPTIPAFFAYTFKEKRSITKMTGIFFLGFAIIFVILGMIASSIGASLASFPNEYYFLPVIGGLFLLLMGILEIFGKGFSSILKIRAKSHDQAGIFTMGVAFAVGWSACLGPILFGILSIAAVLGNYVYAAFLMLFYSLGIFVPLFILSFFYDKYNFGKSRIIRGKSVSIAGKKFHSTHLIAGVVMIAMGLIFIFYEGTAVVNTMDLTGTKQLFYDWQRALFNVQYVNIIGFIVLAVFLFLIWRFVRRYHA